MKKFIVMVIMAVVASTTVFAQSAYDLASQKRAQDKAYMKNINAKPSKDAKKQEKMMMKDGWRTMGSGGSIATMITRDQLLSYEQMSDGNGGVMNRYLQHSASAVAGSQSAAYAAARTACQTEIAAMLKTEIAAAAEHKIDNQQNSGINALTVDKFHQRVKSVIDGVLSDCQPGLNIYRMLPNYNYEVQMTISFDKQQIYTRLQEMKRQQLENEGDKDLDELLDAILSGF